jgi:hypothetical protein
MRGCVPSRVFSVVILALAAAGCASPYATDQGALVGGLGGAGVGALVGSSVGHPVAGALIGAGAGTLTGAVVGSEIDREDARNRALIAQQMGRQIAAGAVTVDDVINMTHAGVNEELIISHVRCHGMVRPLQTSDLIVLQQQGVSVRVIQTMQEPPHMVQPMMIQPAPPPVVVDPYWGPRYYYPPPPGYYYRPGVSWGVTVGR